MSGRLEDPTLEGDFDDDYDTGNIPIGSYDDGDDFEDEEIPPGYTEYDENPAEGGFRSYDTYDPSMLDNDEPEAANMNDIQSLNSTLGSTDIVIDGEKSPVFSHPAAKALAASILRGNQHHADEPEDGGEYDEEFASEYEGEEVVGLDASLAAGSALSAVRSRSQGKDASHAEEDDNVWHNHSASRGTEEAVKAAIAITGDVSTGQPSAKALESLNRRGGSSSSGIPQPDTGKKGEKERRSKLTEIRKGREPVGGIVIEADVTNEEIEKEEKVERTSSKKNGTSRSSRENSLERVGNSNDKTVKSSAPPPRRNSSKMDSEPEIEESEEEKAARKEAAKALKNKTAAMLAAIAEQKAKDAEEKRKREEAQKKRKAILTARVVAEAAERRSMSMEDKEKYQSSKDAPVLGSRESKKKRDEEEAKAAEQSNRGLSKEQSDALVARLKARQQLTADGVELSQTMSVPARDFNDWKRKNSVPKDAQVFAMTGWYPCVKQALLDRGWVQNADLNSPYFDLKWTLRSLECDQSALQSWQLTNHFMKNIAITTKVGLIKSLRNLVWLADVHTNDVIPRGYDLSINSEMQTFIDDFRCQHALNVLKSLYYRATGVSFPPKEQQPSAEEGKGKSSGSDDEDSDEEYYDTEYVVPPPPRILSSAEVANLLQSSENTPDEEEEESGLFKAMGPDCDSGDGPTDDGDDYDEAEGATASASAAAAKGAPIVTKKAKKAKKASKAQALMGADTQINACVFACCCAVLERSLRPTDDNFLDVMETEGAPTENSSQAWNTGAASSNAGAGAIDPYAVISSLQWEIISTYDLYSAHTLPEQGLEPVDGFIPKEKDGEESNLESAGGKGKGNPNTGANSILNQQRLMREKKRKEGVEKKERTAMSTAIQELRTVSTADISRANGILHGYHKKEKAQAGLNGCGASARNIWIVKPGAKSRGRGIKTFADLPKMLKYVDAGTGSAQASQWVVQKYMENPLTIARHKFDLRQWVLVTDWNPLTIYFYDECYARFGVEKYTTSEEGLENAYVHLVNNSISKNNEKFHIPIHVDQGDDIEGFMWSQESFRNWLQSTTGKDMMMSKIQPRMKEIAQWSLMCASECIEHRKNSWELYGFDFMVDDNYNAWLIEINSSPACDYSTKVTERYVQKALVELLSVTLDMRDWESKSKKEQKTADKPDTGGWGLLYKGPFLEMPTTAFGADMTLKGDALKAPKKKVPQPIRMGFDPNAGRGIITNGQGEVIETGGSSSLRSMPIPPTKEPSQVMPFPNRGRAVNAPHSRNSASAPAARTQTSQDISGEPSAPRIAGDSEPLNGKYGATQQKQSSRMRASKAAPSFDGALNNSLEGSLMNDSIDSVGSMGGFARSSRVNEDGGSEDNDEEDTTQQQAAKSHAGRGFPKDRSLSPARGFTVSSMIPSAPGPGPSPAMQLQQKSLSTAQNASNPLLSQSNIPSGQFKVGGGALVVPSSINGATLTESQILASEMKENMNARMQVREMREQRAKDIVAARKVPVPPVGRDSAPVKAKVFELPF